MSYKKSMLKQIDLEFTENISISISIVTPTDVTGYGIKIERQGLHGDNSVTIPMEHVELVNGEVQNLINKFKLIAKLRDWL